MPYLFGVVRLYDGAGHAEAMAVAAQIRDAVANDEKILCRFSIEGSTLKKEGNTIKQCIFRRVAITIKPCLKACDTILLSDPNAPEGFKKSENTSIIDPEYAQLSGYETEVEIIDSKAEASLNLLRSAMVLSTVRKAIEAGMGGGAPSSLTGGAALQKEHVDDRIRNTCKAVLRDFGNRKFTRSEFMGFAKAKLPEVSDDFLNHFADIAEAYTVKKSLAKREGDAPATPPEAPKPDKPILEDFDDSEQEEAKAPKFTAATFRGTKIRPNPSVKHPSFDPKKGVLRTPMGSFKAYLPSDDGPESAANYEKLLKSPEVEKAMDTAMTNWSKVHKLIKAGKLPPEVIMHAVMFAQLSPNRPVPVQELQYARLVDAMHATGLDPRNPGFSAIEPKFRELDSPNTLPETGKEAFATNPAYYVGNRIGIRHDEWGEFPGDPTAAGRYAGELPGTTPLMEGSFKNLSRYHSLHHGLVDLVSRHRHHALDAVSELMGNKHKGQLWEAKRERAKLLGKPDPGESPFTAVPGLAVKTGLYTYGMLGGGDSVVPDTHFIRNMFGLHVMKDKRTLTYLKNMLWNPNNIDTIMRPYNDWYAKNHPAVKYTLNHPKWGSTFEDPKDALFPAFWRHWITIRPHEQFVGMTNKGKQSGTHHEPFWDSIKPWIDPVQKSDEPDSGTSLRTALVHQSYVEKYGEIPAQFLYYHHLVPKLLEAAEHRERNGQNMEFLAKAREMEAALIDLRKDIADAIEPKIDMPTIYSVGIKHGDKIHPAGRFSVSRDVVHHLEDYHGLLHAMVPEGKMDASAIAGLHGLKWSPNFSVTETTPSTEVAKPNPVPELTVMKMPMPKPNSVFEFHRPGMVKPHTIEFGPHGAAMDGHALTEGELQLILHNAKTGIGTVRYKKMSSEMRKDEETLHLPPEPTVPDHRTAIAQARQIHGHDHPITRALVHGFYGDPMIPGIGNKRAASEFREENRPGVWVSADGNSFKQVNDIHGHDAGDSAIKAMGGAFRDAAAKVGTGKAWRSGGDEMSFWAPTHEHAAQFIRHAKAGLEALPPVNGQHKLSMSFGLGHNFETADKALGMAKEQKFAAPSLFNKVLGTKRKAMYSPQKTPNFVHSLVPGHEGPMPIDSGAPPAGALPSSGAQAGVAGPKPPSPK